MKRNPYKIKACWITAKKFFKNHPDIDFEDLLSEAVIAYSIAKKEFRKDKNAAFSTYLCAIMHNRLIDFCGNIDRHNLNEQPKDPSIIGDPYPGTWESVQIDPKMINFPIAPDAIFDFRDSMIRNLGDEAKEVCSMIFNSPGEFFSLENLTAKLNKEKGWKEYYAKSVYREIRKFLCFYSF
jgi:hypothetical protein